jgi:predicted ATPase
MADAMQNPVLQIPAGSLVSFPAYFMGDYVEACRYAEKALALYTLEHERAIMALFHLPCSFACAHIRAMGLWCLGYPEKAAQQWREAKRMIEDLDIPAAKTFELGYMLHSHHLRRDRASIEAISEPAHKRAADEGFLFWSSQANVFHGWARSMDGDTQIGIAEMKSALESYCLTGSKLNLSLFSLMMAEAQVQAGRVDDALASIADGLKHIAESCEHAQEPELHRLHGEIHLMLGDVAAAEASLRRAIQVAQTYKAKMFEARAAARLARLLQSKGRMKEAFALLQPLDEWFAEGRDTPDVRELGTILRSLDAAHSPASQPSGQTTVD